MRSVEESRSAYVRNAIAERCRVPHGTKEEGCMLWMAAELAACPAISNEDIADDFLFFSEENADQFFARCGCDDRSRHILCAEPPLVRMRVISEGCIRGTSIRPSPLLMWRVGTAVRTIRFEAEFRREDQRNFAQGLRTFSRVARPPRGVDVGAAAWNANSMRWEFRPPRGAWAVPLRAITLHAIDESRPLADQLATVAPADLDDDGGAGDMDVDGDDFASVASH